MKRIGFSLLLILFLTTVCFGQVYVNDVAIDTLNTPYCQLIGSNAGPWVRAHVIIDYGQRYVDTGLNRQKVTGPDRQPITFNSTVDALNFMIRNGWELVSSQVVGNKEGSERTFIYLLQRRKKPDSRANQNRFRPTRCCNETGSLCRITK